MMTKGEFANGFFIAVPLTFIADSALYTVAFSPFETCLFFPDQQGAKTFQSQTLSFGKQRSLSHFLHPWGIFLALLLGQSMQIQ
jgi:hypothetical protein